MILCFALFKNNRSPSTNLINWVRVELLGLLDLAIGCNDQTAEIAARIGIEYCNCFTTISKLERAHVSHNLKQLWEKQLWERKLDYQQRVFTLFDFMRDKLRSKTKINIDRWLGVDEIRFDAGFLDKDQITTLRTLSSQLKEILATD